MEMSLVILAIVLASFALGFRFADIRAEALDRVRSRLAVQAAISPATARRAATALPARLRAAPVPRTPARRAPARAAVSAASAPRS